MIKTVVNLFGGTAVATDWTLNATGPTPISGVTGSAAVTNAPVAAGSYSIFESNGPPGYASSAWSCTTNLRTLFRHRRNVGARARGVGDVHDLKLRRAAHLTLVKQ